MSIEIKEIKLSSGNVLYLSLAPFADAKKLYQVISRELKSVSLKDGLSVEAGKELVFTLLSSEEIDDAAMNCALFCLYGKDKDKISSELFESVDVRSDYLEIMYHVIRENCHPFMKNLLQKYGGLMEKAKEILSKDHA